MHVVVPSRSDHVSVSVCPMNDDYFWKCTTCQLYVPFCF